MIALTSWRGLFVANFWFFLDILWYYAHRFHKLTLLTAASPLDFLQHPHNLWSSLTKQSLGLRESPAKRIHHQSILRAVPHQDIKMTKSMMIKNTLCSWWWCFFTVWVHVSRHSFQRSLTLIHIDQNFRFHSSFARALWLPFADHDDDGRGRRRSLSMFHLWHSRRWFLEPYNSKFTSNKCDSRMWPSIVSRDALLFTSHLCVLQLYFLCRKRTVKTKGVSLSHLWNNRQARHTLHKDAGRCAMWKGYQLES